MLLDNAERERCRAHLPSPVRTTPGVQPSILSTCKRPSRGIVRVITWQVQRKWFEPQRYRCDWGQIRAPSERGWTGRATHVT